MATTQMNVRIDDEVKRGGDAAFSEIGYTPSRVVRAMWGYAARNRHNTAEVASMLGQLEGTDNRSPAPQASTCDLVAQGPEIFLQAIAAFGVDANSPTARIPYEDLLAAAYQEKQADWGNA